MGRKQLRFGFTPQEHRVSALPAALAAVLVLLLIILNGTAGIPSSAWSSVLFFAVGLGGLLYLLTFNFLVIPSAHYEPVYSWLNAAVTGGILAALLYLLPDSMDIYLGVLLIIFVIISALVSRRPASYFLIAFVTVSAILLRGRELDSAGDWPLRLSLDIIAVIIVETIEQLKSLSREHIRRLEAVTEFSRAIASSLETKQVIALLSAALQNSVVADSYFVGFREGDELRLDLIYDDGEYYDNQKVKLDGSLSGWVLDNQQSLFLPDLRKEVHLSSVRLVLVGRHKTSLSWMGVPMRGASVDGLMAISAYKPNAFELADLELLTNLAQHAVQALDNTYQHAQVELQTRLDSLTNVYNHGHFLKLLQEHVTQAAAEGRQVSVIMLDIDHFKQYNDSYGHLVGDEILTHLCKIIKGHIKNSDAVGRWGGEEFVISLVGAGADQAQQVAERIRGSMSKLLLYNLEHVAIPVPTISQGIAVFPAEARETIKLIDLADKRLYVAKERGRNQIEPESDPAPAARRPVE